EPEPEPEPEPEIVPMESVTVDEAESLMSDSEAHRLQEENIGYVDTEVYSGTKKTEVNIDTISLAFSDGDTVTLNTLKEKKLVPKNAGHVKILARGSLDKKLTVVAQDFSDAALKMILLTGGEAVVTYPSAERGGKSADSK
ncbi:MAG: uL15 family ribosomal protein, partial [Clostridia bacterium]|nr:uL15 family ribosomal protein [Clostridia bacterium]